MILTPPCERGAPRSSSRRGRGDAAEFRLEGGGSPLPEGLSIKYVAVGEGGFMCSTTKVVNFNMHIAYMGAALATNNPYPWSAGSGGYVLGRFCAKA